MLSASSSSSSSSSSVSTTTTGTNRLHQLNAQLQHQQEASTSGSMSSTTTLAATAALDTMKAESGAGTVTMKAHHYQQSTSTKQDAGAGPLGPVFRIVPGVQSYDWGIVGKKGSAVARYAFRGTGAQHLGTQYDENKPYAELWMGTHASLPSYILPEGASSAASTSKQTLSDYLVHNPALLSESVVKHFNVPLDNVQKAKSVLPFLFKILSVGKALSIQAHPDRSLAQRLHREKPNMYKDDNHKPEMAIAITDFRGFCGFKPLEEVANFLQTVPEFRGIVRPSSSLLERTRDTSSKSEAERKELLQSVFAGLMKASEEDIRRYTQALVDRHTAGEDISEAERAAEIPMLVRTLHSQFPNDIGIFCAFLLNHLRLTPGQALFLGANEPHAYLEGEIVECMAASDNVVRAGLTPKARDVDVLVDMLTYDHGPGERQYMRPSKWNGSAYTSLYQPPIDEFNVLRTTLDQSGAVEQHRAIRGPSILIVTSGGGSVAWEGSGESSGTTSSSLDLAEGNTLFIGANTPLTLTASAPGTTIFRAFVEA